MSSRTTSGRAAGIAATASSPSRRSRRPRSPARARAGSGCPRARAPGPRRERRGSRRRRRRQREDRRDAEALAGRRLDRERAAALLEPLAHARQAVARTQLGAPRGRRRARGSRCPRRPRRSRATGSRRARGAPRSSRSPARSAARPRPRPGPRREPSARRRCGCAAAGCPRRASAARPGGRAPRASRSVPTTPRTSPRSSFVTDWAVSTRARAPLGAVARDLEVQRERGEVVAEQIVQVAARCARARRGARSGRAARASPRARRWPRPALARGGLLARAAAPSRRR